MIEEDGSRFIAARRRSERETETMWMTRRGKKKNRGERERSLESWCCGVLSAGTRALRGRVRETGPLEISQTRFLRAERMKRSRRSSTPSPASGSRFSLDTNEHTHTHTIEQAGETRKREREKSCRRYFSKDNTRLYADVFTLEDKYSYHIVTIDPLDSRV